MTLDVIGFGESSIDYVYTVARLPTRADSKVEIDEHFSAVGGQVATTMAACAGLGLQAGYLGAVGSDANGAWVRTELESRGVNVSRLIVQPADTRYAVILVEEGSGDRQVLWQRDRRLAIDPETITADLFAGARIVHVDAVDEPASIRLATLARDAGLIVTSDIDTVTPRTPELLDAVTVAILAEPVPQQLTGEANMERALRALAARHRGTSARSTSARSTSARSTSARQHVARRTSHVARRTWLAAATLGERGAAAFDGDRFYHAPAMKVTAVDTTGAGDVFRAGMIYGLLQQWDTPQILEFANKIAGESCTRRGAMGGLC